MAFRAFKLRKNVHFKAIFQFRPISIVDNWKSGWINKNSHISGSINATEMCQYFLESSDHGLQLMLTWTLEAQEAVNWPQKVRDSKIGGSTLQASRRFSIFQFEALSTLPYYDILKFQSGVSTFKYPKLENTEIFSFFPSMPDTSLSWAIYSF